MICSEILILMWSNKLIIKLLQWVITKDKVTEVFYLMDEFCQNFKKEFDDHLVGNASKKPLVMSDREISLLRYSFILGISDA